MPLSSFQKRAIAAAAVLVLMPLAARSADEPVSAARGRHIALIAGCNACHTEDFAPSAGQVPQDRWLLGSTLGQRGPWGTTYPANLRIYMQNMTAEQWVAAARTTVMRPPMPWFDLRELSDDELRSLHAFVRSLGPVGSPAPAYLPPGQAPNGPFILYPAPPPGKP